MTRVAKKTCERHSRQKARKLFTTIQKKTLNSQKLTSLKTVIFFRKKHTSMIEKKNNVYFGELKFILRVANSGFLHFMDGAAFPLGR